MRSCDFQRLVCVVTVVVSGCIAAPPNPMQSAVQQTERRVFEYHDPLPDSGFGPDTQTRPRGFSTQRTEPRRAAEQRALQGYPVSPLPPLGSRYSGVVRE